MIAAFIWFISSEKENPILILTRDMPFEWWQKHDKIYHYFLMHFFFTMATEFYNGYKHIFIQIYPATSFKENGLTSIQKKNDSINKKNVNCS